MSTSCMTRSWLQVERSVAVASKKRSRLSTVSRALSARLSATTRSMASRADMKEATERIAMGKRPTRQNRPTDFAPILRRIGVDPPAAFARLEPVDGDQRPLADRLVGDVVAAAGRRHRARALVAAAEPGLELREIDVAQGEGREVVGGRFRVRLLIGGDGAAAVGDHAAVAVDRDDVAGVAALVLVERLLEDRQAVLVVQDGAAGAVDHDGRDITEHPAVRILRDIERRDVDGARAEGE